jgi:hypothetical protein
MTQREEQKRADDARLMRAWRKWHREELEETLAGPHGPMIERLAFILKALTVESAPLLLAYIRGVNWATVDYPTRLVVLHEINAAITKLRERSGLLPFDDGFPGDRPNVFQTIRTILIPAEAAPSGAHAGLEKANPTNPMKRG